MALSREYRLKGSRSFSVLQKKGKIFRSPLFFVKMLPSTSGGFRCAVVVSKKVHSSAVHRNRLRRRFLEAIRLSLQNFSPPSYILLFFPSLEGGKIPFSKILDDISSFFHSLTHSS